MIVSLLKFYVNFCRLHVGGLRKDLWRKTVPKFNNSHAEERLRVAFKSCLV